MINIIIKNTFLKYSLVLFIMFFFFYSVNFTFIPIHSYKIIIVLLCSYVLFEKINFMFYKNIRILLVFFLFLLSWTALSYILNAYSDITVLKAILLLFVKSILGISFLVFILIKFKFTFKNILFLLQIIITIQSFFILIYFFNIDFKQWAIEYIPAAGNVHPLDSFRSRGLMHSSGATAALIQSFGLLITAYCISITKWKSKIYIYLLFSFLLIFISILLTGRTGLLMLPVIFLYLLIVYRYKKEYKKNISVFCFSFLLLFIFSILIVFILNYYQIYIIDNKVSLIINWIVNEVSIKNGTIHIYTLDVLSSHWIAPSDLKTWIIGDPSTWRVERIKSDIGYIRILHAFGLLGFLMFYSFFIYIFYKTIRSLDNLEDKVLVFLLALLLFITESKEPFLLKTIVNSFVLFLFLFVSLNVNIQKNKD